jgi:hypothetical protein
MFSAQGSNQKILIASIDYDDCSSIATEALRKHLIAASKSGKYQEVVLMDGSSRQEPDRAQAPFTVLEQLRKEIQTETNIPCLLDKYLLFDVYKQYHLPQDIFKCSIKYLQIHKKSNDYKGADIDYYFYDNDLDILNFLNSFYSKETELMPFNLNAELHQYDGYQVNHLYTIRGSGVIDQYFIDNILFMTECTGCHNHRGNRSWDIGDILYGNRGNSNELYKFKAGRRLSPQNILLELSKEIKFVADNRHPEYKKEDYDHFIQSHYLLYTEIEKDINRLTVNHSQDEILLSNTIKIARETRYMLLQFKAPNIHSSKHANNEMWIDPDRNNVLLHYADDCLPSTQLFQITITALAMSSVFLLGQCNKTIGIIWSEWESHLSEFLGCTKTISKFILGLGMSSLIKQSVNHLFFPTDEKVKQIYAIKNDLKKFADNDEVELSTQKNLKR